MSMAGKTGKREWRDVLKPYFGKRCCIKGACSYESGLYFYAFDAQTDKALLKAVLDTVSDAPEYLEEVDAEDVVIFGFATEADFDDEMPAKDRKIFAKKGLVGLARELAYPSPLVYDRSTGNAYFFPDGSPSTLSKDGEKKITLDKLKIRIVE
jgi:hypothetical protein